MAGTFGPVVVADFGEDARFARSGDLE